VEDKCRELPNTLFDSDDSKCHCLSGFEGDLKPTAEGLDGSCTVKENVCFHRVGWCGKSELDVEQCTIAEFSRSLSDASSSALCLGATLGGSVSGGGKLPGVGEVTVEVSAEFSTEFCSESSRTAEVGKTQSFNIPGLKFKETVGCAVGIQMHETWKGQKLTFVSYAEGLYFVYTNSSCPEPACEFGPEEAATAWKNAMVDCDFFGNCPEGASPAVSRLVLPHLLLAGALLVLLGVNGG